MCIECESDISQDIIVKVHKVTAFNYLEKGKRKGRSIFFRNGIYARRLVNFFFFFSFLWSYAELRDELSKVARHDFCITRQTRIGTTTT